jgi:hypothetical protein
MSTRPVTFGAFVPQGWKTELVDIGGTTAKWAKAVEIAELPACQLSNGSPNVEPPIARTTAGGDVAGSGSGGTAGCW